MRARRANEQRAIAFERFCAEAGIEVSPQSSLNTALWPTWARSFIDESNGDAIERMYRNGIGTTAIARKLGLSRARTIAVIRQRCRIEAT